MDTNDDNQQFILRRHKRENDMNHDKEKTRFFETKISVMWLITTLGFCIAAVTTATWNFSGQLSTQNQKMDTLIAAFAELRSADKERDSKFDLLRESMFTTQRIVDAHELRLNALERLPLSSPRQAR